MLGKVMYDISDFGASNDRLCMMAMGSLFIIGLMILLIYVLYKFLGIWGADLDNGEENPEKDDGDESE